MAPTLDDGRWRLLEDGWEQVQRFGWLGDAPVRDHVEHSLGLLDFATRWVGDWEGRSVADLGSGAGVPGLVWAAALPESTEVHLIERSSRRASFLRLMVARLDAGARVRVWAEPAERCTLDGMAGRLDVVVARSFGSPAAVTPVVERLLGPTGTAVVSDAPEQGRWDVGVFDSTTLELAGRSTGWPAAVALRRSGST